MLLVAGGVPGARAHQGGTDAPPILESVSPEVPGLDVRVVYSANYQFVVTNTTASEFVVFAESGEPFIRIGPDGAFGNFASPAWFDSGAPDGLDTFPRAARAGADVPPDWRLVRRQPSYGWFDHRLHPVERYVDEAVTRSRVPVTIGEPWRVPIRLGETDGEISGRFEFQPLLGSYRSRLESPGEPRPGVTVQLSPSSTRGGVPALFLVNATEETLTVLGQEGEPFVRLGAVAEVNTRSPTWQAISEAQGNPVTGGDVADAGAAPAWKEVQSSSRWGWPELRAAPPVANPNEEIAEREEATTVKRWEVPFLLGAERLEISGITEFVPNPAGAAEATDGERSEGGGGTAGWTAALLVGAAPIAVLLALRRRARSAA